MCDRERIETVLFLNRRGVIQKKIAGVIDRSQSNVSQTLKKYGGNKLFIKYDKCGREILEQFDKNGNITIPNFDQNGKLKRNCL